MTTYERIEDLRMEIQSAREDLPQKSGQLELISNSLEIAIKQVPTNREQVWDKILHYLWDRMGKSVYDLARTE